MYVELHIGPKRKQNQIKRKKLTTKQQHSNFFFNFFEEEWQEGHRLHPGDDRGEATEVLLSVIIIAANNTNLQTEPTFFKY